MKKIKILKETPFHKEGTELSLSDFIMYYPVMVKQSNYDEKILTDYLKNERELCINYPAEKASHPLIGKFFEVIEYPQWAINEWVWHEKLSLAMRVSDKRPDKMWPNEITSAAANEYTDTYKRKATEKEIDDNILVLVALYFGDNDDTINSLLVGRNVCYYYHNNIWKGVTGVREVVEHYFKYLNMTFPTVSIHSPIEKEEPLKYSCSYEGLTVGCQHLSHETLLKIHTMMNRVKV